MLDQMFSTENFRYIFDLENRRGNDLTGHFFPSIAPLTNAIKEKTAALKQLRKHHPSKGSTEYAKDLHDLKTIITQLKAAKSDAIDGELRSVSDKILDPRFTLQLLPPTKGPKDKPIYRIEDIPEAYFVVKQLQRNLNRLYKVKQSNRHEQVCRVRDTISNKFPYELVRTDVAEFYETINRKRLLLRLEEDQLLSPSSIRFIKQLLKSFETLTNKADGIPRGVGVSAYLAELYLRDVDHQIKDTPGLIMYCRYVDDIVAIFARPPIGVAPPSYKTHIETILSQFSLTAHPTKTFSKQVGGNYEFEFDFLGYCFKRPASLALQISPSAAKLEKYRSRLKKAFNVYAKERHFRGRKAYRELVARIKFLTGNTRLLNSKSSVMIGVYYSNSLATDLSAFESLDTYLNKMIKALKSPKLRLRLKKLKFKNGFEQRTFFRFTSIELSRIQLPWKNPYA